jgi:hypothetical protein
VIDNELVKNNFQISPRCEQAMQELSMIYYAQKAVFAVAPPTTLAIEKCRKAKDWLTD